MAPLVHGECTILTLPHTCMYDPYKEIYKLSKLAQFLCNVKQKNSNQTLIWFDLDELLGLDKEPLNVQF